MTNPLLAPWGGLFGLPAFDRIEPAHFPAAFDAALAEQEAEFEAIATQPEPPSFANTVEALERSGRLLARVGAVFWNRAGSDTNDEIQAIERDIAPRLSQHFARQLTDGRMFARIEAIAASPGALTPEQARLVERVHKKRVRAGARLDEAGRERMQAIMRRLSELGTAFGQNVLKDEAAWSLRLGADDLAGLPESFVDAASAEAERRGEPGFVVTLARSSVEPFLTFSVRRDLREVAFRAWTARGEATNWPIVAETLRLRAERARLLGYSTFARFKLDDEMAASPDRARELLMAVWEPARRRAGEEAEALQALAAEEGADIRLAPWDWRFYAEKLRRRLHDLDEGALKPYLALDNVLAAAFDVAGRLFGLQFTPADAPVPHADARAWEVRRDGAHLGLFIGDYFARPSKRSGAWASGLRGQQKLWEPGRPVVLNTCNFAPGAPPLLGWDDAQTLFHEFGHALHMLLSEVTYPSLAGTAVARDFVELPSQLFEHWLGLPQVLERHARHHRTGAPMPEALIARVRAAATFNQGFKTVEYVASALVDLDMHELGDLPEPDWADFDPRRLRGRRAPPDRHAGRHRHAPPDAALPPCLLGRRLLGRLLQLYVVRGARRRRLSRFRGGGRPVRPGDGRAARAPHPLGRRHPEAGGRMGRLPRPHAGRRGAARGQGPRPRAGLNSPHYRRAWPARTAGPGIATMPLRPDIRTEDRRCPEAPPSPLVGEGWGGRVRRLSQALRLMWRQSMDALDRAFAAARARRRTLVLPEGAEPRIAEAAARLAAEGLARVLLIGGRAPGCETIDPATDPRREVLAALVAGRRARMTPAMAARLLDRPACFAGALVAAGEATAMVAGAATPDA